MEQSYHKKEGEGVLEEYRKRRIKEGAITPVHTESHTEERARATTDKLAEIYGEETRLDAKPPNERRFAQRQMPPIATERSTRTPKLGKAIRPNQGRHLVTCAP